MRHLVICFMVLLTPICLAETNVAQPGCSEDNAARLVSLQGVLSVDTTGSGQWQSAHLEQTLCEGNRIKVDANSRASILLPNGVTLRLAEGTVLTLNGIVPNQTTALDLVKGFVHFISRTPRQLQITTPIANAGPEGTEFALRADAASAELWVYEGAVRFFNTYGDIHLKAGEAGQTLLGQAPRAQIDLKPADAVNWALYYPPLLTYSESGTLGTPALQAAIQNYRQGRVDLALTALEQTPQIEQSALFFKTRAAIRLTAGQSQLAMQDIQVLRSSNGNDADAMALESILALTQNRKTEALSLAERAVVANSASAIAYSALSYSQQAGFELEKALTTAQRASQLAPNDAITWARLSELQLALGLRPESAESAARAFALDPNLERTQTVQGFSHLFRVNTAQALQHFDSAVKLDSTAPLPRLGLGLTKIRSGDLEAGRRDLEIAAILDPNNSLLRSYLGKAYYEENRPALAGDQFDLAKQYDPNDPTPYFYDALRKQSLNRPVEALRDMQQSIELNENRGVYRSKLLLDEDAAARTANLARIYNDLGFGRVALQQAWKSLGHDAADPSAHRFLSDAYVGQPRYRVARASELLQAQLLQPINITPVQPQLTGENIGILNNTGPGNLSANEYDALYTGNGAHIVLNGAYGSRNTKTNTAIVSGVYDKLSMSLGQFHYHTDGFRQNDDYQQNIYNAFAQYAFTPDFSLQAELKSENVRAGDIAMRLNESHDATLRQTIRQETARVGGHYRIDPEQDIIASGFYTSRDEAAGNQLIDLSSPRSINWNISNPTAGTKSSGYQTEWQYLFHPDKFELIAGVGYTNLENQFRFNNNINFFVPPPLLRNSSVQQQYNTDRFNGYIYSKQYLLPGLITTVGISYDSVNNQINDFASITRNSNGTTRPFQSRPNLLSRDQINPKFGISWTPFDNITFRGAVFRTMNRQLTANQTIEPTQIAGFNQFFDENNDARAWRYGFGTDYHPVKNLFIGGEISWRDSQQPFSDNGVIANQNRAESSHLAYLYFTPMEWIALKSEYRFDATDRTYIIRRTSSNNPQSVDTHQVPISLSLFHPSGLFAKISGTYVDQQVASVSNSAVNQLNYRSEDFWTFDTAFGYRMPKRLGTINFEVRNLFDNTFNYQSNFDASGPQLSPFIPERQLFVKLSLFY